MPLLMLEMRVPGTKKCSATTWNARVMPVSTHLLGRVEQRAHVRRSLFPQVFATSELSFQNVGSQEEEHGGVAGQSQAVSAGEWWFASIQSHAS